VENVVEDEAWNDRLEELLQRLFCLQDLKGNDLLEEQELVKLNEKIAMLHYGRDTDRQVVKAKFRDVFRANLDSEGLPVPYSVFRTYMMGVLDAFDDDLNAQEMILEQFIAEAQLARRAFYQASFASETDGPFMPRHISRTESNFGSSPSPPSAGSLNPPRCAMPFVQARCLTCSEFTVRETRPTCSTAAISTVPGPCPQQGGVEPCPQPLRQEPSVMVMHRPVARVAIPLPGPNRAKLRQPPPL